LGNRREHQSIAARLARLLGYDPCLARFGAILPDLDRHPPLKHRETLHNPVLPFVLPLHTSKELRSIALGYISHVVVDAMQLPVALIFQLADEFRATIARHRG